jgi:hypothetical protein
MKYALSVAFQNASQQSWSISKVEKLCELIIVDQTNVKSICLFEEKQKMTVFSLRLKNTFFFSLLALHDYLK